MLQFYDGLRFDRVVRQEGVDEEGKPTRVVVLEAGSPVESADPACSHLGYWLRPEFSDEAKHDEGTVGACLAPSEDNAETAACRFYITLTPAPAMDGNFTVFGRIVKGIEVARMIAEQPVRGEEAGPDHGRPTAPITIRKASVRAIPVVQ
jgi:cyclophilin family peptidyl-prolyl cis-trans isomerase